MKKLIVSVIGLYLLCAVAIAEDINDYGDRFEITYQQGKWGTCITQIIR